jgi:uncharacterized membrane protein YeaQ/YmgE (transglycosylase-associated protein family)
MRWTQSTNSIKIGFVQKEKPMEPQSLITFLVIGAVAGWLGSAIVKSENMGLHGNIVVGIIGAFIAGYVLPIVGFAFGGGILGSILNATIGAVILLVLLRIIKRA